MLLRAARGLTESGGLARDINEQHSVVLANNGRTLARLERALAELWEVGSADELPAQECLGSGSSETRPRFRPRSTD